MNRWYGFIRLTVLSAIWWGVAAAQSDNILLDLEADSIRYDYNTGNSVYEGNVVIIQGDLRLTGDRVEVFSENGEVSRLVSHATPSTFQRRSGDGGAGGSGVDAEADRIEYDIRRTVVMFIGNAVVRDGEKILSGERIVYDLEKRIVDAPQGKGRVRLTINP